MVKKVSIVFCVLAALFVNQSYLLAKSTISQEMIASENQLVSAAKKNNLREVKRLLKEGVHPDAIHRPIMGYVPSPLYIAAENGNLEIAKLLVQHGADVNYNPSDRIPTNVLKAAVAKDNAELVQHLLEHGAQVALGGRFSFWRPSESEKKSESYAIVQKKIEEMKLLHEKLITAVTNKEKQEIQRLISQGVYLNATTDKHDKTAIYYAIETGDAKIFNLLIKNGASIHVKYGGDSPLAIAVRDGYTAIVQTILEAGAFVDEPNSLTWQTPLMNASRFGYKEIAKIILDSGADIDRVNKEGKKAAEIAQEYKQIEIMEMIDKASADPNRKVRRSPSNNGGSIFDVQVK